MFIGEAMAGSKGHKRIARLHHGGERVLRQHFFDLGKALPQHLRDLLPEPDKRLDGSVIVWGYVGRGECIYTYDDGAGGQVRLYRPGSVVFDAGNLETLKAVAVTLGHPDDEMMVHQGNWVEVSRGSVLEAGRAYAEYGLVAAPLHLSGQDALDAYDGGLHALSTGEWSWETREPGEVGGQPFDTKMIGHQYNHVALVPAGAAGPLARLRVNQLPYSLQNAAGGGHVNNEDAMEFVEIIVNGHKFWVRQNAVEAERQRIEALFVQASRLNTDAQAELERLREENAELKATAERLQGQLDEMREHMEGGDSEEEMEERVNSAVSERMNARIELFGKVAPLLGGKTTVEGEGGKVVQLYSLPEDELLKQAIRLHRPKAKLDDYSVERLHGRLDAILEHKAISDKAEEDLDDASTTARQNAGGGDEADARKKRLEEARKKQAQRFSGR